MKRWLGISVVLGLFGGFGVACSSTTDAKPYPDLASFCVAKAKEECQIAPTCAVDPTACQSVRSAKCNTDAAMATAGGARTYNADNAKDCIDAVHGVYAAGKVLLADLTVTGLMGDKCQRVFQGTAEKNKPCTTAYDCVSGRICAPAQPGLPTLVCADKVDKALGDFCADPGSVCAAGSYCAQATGSAAQCTPDAQMGQPCSATLPCVETLRCAAGVCVARQVPGQACTSNGDCSPTAGFCDTYAGNICTVGLTFATGGADCKGYATGVTPPADAGNDSSPADSSVGDTGTTDATAD